MGGGGAVSWGGVLNPHRMCVALGLMWEDLMKSCRLDHD